MVCAPELSKNWTRFVCSVVFPILRAPHHTVHFWGVQSRDDSSPAIPHAMTGQPFWPYQLLENAKSKWLRMILTEINKKNIGISQQEWRFSNQEWLPTLWYPEGEIPLFPRVWGAGSNPDPGAHLVESTGSIALFDHLPWPSMFIHFLKPLVSWSQWIY